MARAGARSLWGRQRPGTQAACPVVPRDEGRLLGPGSPFPSQRWDLRGLVMSILEATGWAF